MANARIVRSIFLCLLSIALFCFSVPNPSAPADIVWTDDFNSLTLDDWIVTRGAFSAEQGTLWAYGTESPISNRAYHPSQVKTGKWSFDILLKEEWHWEYHPPTVRFMVDSLDDLEWRGYIIDFYTIHRKNSDTFTVNLRKHTDRWEFVARYDYDKPANGWQHVEITRLSSGRITIGVNRTQLIDVVDIAVETSNYFLFDTEDCAETTIDPITRMNVFVEAKESPMLDNIVVIEFVDNNISLISILLFMILSSILVALLLAYGRKRFLPLSFRILKMIFGIGKKVSKTGNRCTRHPFIEIG